MKSKTRLLSTVLLDQPLINKAEEKGIALDDIAFIQVDTVKESELLAKTEDLYSLPITAVFTSAHAVSALSKLIYISKPHWKIYCTGNTTKNAVLDYFHISAIKGIANDAATLAEIILMDGISEVVFFCGDKHLDTLPQILRENEVSVREIIVYQTVETPQIACKEYDGILFFSPSGVNSFFSVNNVQTDAVLFAIGGTTAAAIAQRAANKIIVNEIPSKEQLVLQALQYFHKKDLGIQSEQSR